MKAQVNSHYQYGCQEQETVAHIFAKCGHDKFTDYKARHDSILQELLQSVLCRYEISASSTALVEGGQVQPQVIRSKDSYIEITVDLCMPTATELIARHLDLIVRLEGAIG